MAEKINIKIFIASAGEMEGERLLVDHVFSRLIKSHKHLFLESIRYEYDTVPGTQPEYDTIQDAITPKLVESHIALFIFFTKIGKYTREEFEHAIKEKKKLFAFFKKGFSPELQEIKAFQELLEFKESLKDSVLKQDYNGLETFDKMVYETFNLYLSEKYPVSEIISADQVVTVLSQNNQKLTESNQQLTQILGEKEQKIKELEQLLVSK